MTTFQYKTHGTCSQFIEIDIEGDILQDVRFTGGCSGNLQGIGALTRGMHIDDVIGRLQGIRCGYKGTSCPDQLSQALVAWKEHRPE